MAGGWWCSRRHWGADPSLGAAATHLASAVGLLLLLQPSLSTKINENRIQNNLKQTKNSLTLPKSQSKPLKLTARQKNTKKTNLEKSYKEVEKLKKKLFFDPWMVKIKPLKSKDPMEEEEIWEGDLKNVRERRRREEKASSPNWLKKVEENKSTEKIKTKIKFKKIKLSHSLSKTSETRLERESRARARALFLPSLTLFISVSGPKEREREAYKNKKQKN